MRDGRSEYYIIDTDVDVEVEVDVDVEVDIDVDVNVEVSSSHEKIPTIWHGLQHHWPCSVHPSCTPYFLPLAA